jgi:tetratricopeptide (TPR) repeat protein
MGKNDRAEQSLRKALEIDPKNVAANLNMGMLLAEMNRMDEAKKAFLSVMEADPKNARAAYNLGVMAAEKNIDEAIDWLQRATEYDPEDPNFRYTLAFYLRSKGDVDRAIKVLEESVADEFPHGDTYALLAEVYREKGNKDKALEVYQKAIQNKNLSERERYQFGMLMQKLQSE